MESIHLTNHCSLLFNCSIKLVQFNFGSKNNFKRPNLKIKY